MSENENELKKDITVQTKEELLNALEKDFATSVYKVYMNCLDTEYAFSEVSVKDQKSLTRIMSGNEHRKDVIYDAQCGLINKVALSPGFNVYDLSEYNRLKILVSLYQQNMFQNEVKFICEECGEENKYKIDFTNTIHKLDNYVLEDKITIYENDIFKYTFEVGYPSVKLVSRFYQSYHQRNNRIAKRDVKSNEVITNLEYINLFIKKINIINKQKESSRNITLSDYKVSDIEDILAAFPQDVLYSENGVLKFIINEYLQYVNDAFDKHECWNCHTVHEKSNTNQAEGFF